MITKRFAAFLLLFVIVSVGCFGTVTATYTPDSNIYFGLRPGPYTSDRIIGAKIGTLVITSSEGAGTIYTPGLLNVANGSNITVRGLYSWSDPSTNPTYSYVDAPFTIVAVSYINGRGSAPAISPFYRTTSVPLGGSDDWDPKTVTVNPLEIDFYLMNCNTPDPNTTRTLQTWGNYYKKDTTFTFPNGLAPTIKVAVAHDANTGLGSMASNPDKYTTYVPVNGVDGTASTNVVGSAAYSDIEANGMIYGDKVEEPTPELSFFFTDTQSSFSIQNAVGSNKATITQANIVLTNGISGQTYTQSMTFTDNAASDTAFQLTPESGYGTPLDFNLYLGSDQLTKGDEYYWTGIVNGSNIKDLIVSGIDANAAANGASGTYKDTITVSFTTLP